MFDQIFGNFLVTCDLITDDELQKAIKKEKEVRVKLGFMAVTEKLMTSEQVEEVNKLQAIMDRKFGDIAVEKGYLTQEQINQLLKKQGNIYMVFVQSLIDETDLTLEEIDRALSQFQSMNGLTHSDMDDLVSGETDRVVRLYLPSNNHDYDRACGIAIRTIIRLIDSEAYIDKAYLVDEILADNMAVQKMEGDHQIYLGFAGIEDNLKMVAESYAKEEFDVVDLDALDAVGEFANCINGLNAVELSNQNVHVDMLPPEFYEKPIKIEGNQFCVFPIIIRNRTINFILSIDSQFEIKQLEVE